MLTKVISCVTECDYRFTGESMLKHLDKPGDLPAVTARAAHDMMIYAGLEMVMPGYADPPNEGDRYPEDRLWLDLGDRCLVLRAPQRLQRGFTESVEQSDLWSRLFFSPCARISI